MLISIGTHITLWFSRGGGGGPPIPPLDSHMYLCSRDWLNTIEYGLSRTLAPSLRRQGLI